MAGYTPNYNLKKPDPEDFYNIQDFNDNADKVDTALLAKADLVSGKVPSGQLPTMDYIPNSQKGVANGVASLGADGKIPPAQIPALFILHITFESGLVGNAFAVTGGGFSYSGVVPGELTTSMTVPYPNTTYIVSCAGLTQTVTTSSNTGIYMVTLTSFAALSWAEIAAISQSGMASQHWSIGDEKDITLTTGEILTMQIYDFNHDDLASGGKAGITLGMKNLMATTRHMEATPTNVNSFTGSEMYGWLRDTLLPSLPADLQAVIKPVNKKTSAGNQSTTIKTEAMKVFLFSEIECFGVIAHSVAGEGTQYPIFTDDTSRIKYLPNGAGSAYLWWERSPHATKTTSFCNVYSDGVASTNSATNAWGVCFGFCI